jgi:hypothetical protein
MSDVNGTPQKEKVAKIRRKSERESVLQHTFAAARHNTTSSSPWLEDRQLESRFLQRQCACGTHTIAGGECDSCRQKRESGLLQRTAFNPISDNFALNTPAEVQTSPKMGFAYNFSQVPTHTITPRPTVQPKLTLGAADDHYEREADQVAKAVVSHINLPKKPPENQKKAIQKKEVAKSMSRQSHVSQPLHQENPGLQEDLNDIDELVTESSVQRQATADPANVEPGVEFTIRTARGSGQLLADNIRTPMEQAFGADFSQVKVHTDTRADNLNRSLQARAFTTGQDIFFKQGEYTPNSLGGQELLAHELTHVIQQNGHTVQRQTEEKSQPHSAYDFNMGAIFPVGLIQAQVGAQVVQRTLDVAAAIAYNQNALGGNTQFIPYIKDLLNRATRGHLPNNSVIDEAFVRAVARYQEIRRLPRPHDGKIGSRTRRALAVDLKEFFLGTRSSAAPRALRAAQNIIDIYTNEKILFAWWAGDFRDNNKNNRVDANDPRERNRGDGWPSPSRTFRGFKTIPGTFTSPTRRTLTTTASETDTPVKYKVCADIVSQAYNQAGIMSSTTRSVVSILRHFQNSRHCDVWQIGDADFPDTYLPGDYFCTAEGSHGHAGMIVHEEPTNSGTQRPLVVHLPGSSLQIDRGEYDPTRTSDVRLERWPTRRWIPDKIYLGRSRR